VRERILATLRELRAYALAQGYDAAGASVAFFYHEEDSYLMRFANSAISLNTNEHLVRLGITAYSGKKRAIYDLVTDLAKIEEMKQAVDVAAGMVEHAQPLTYQPTVPVFAESFVDERGYDPALANLSSADKLAFFNRATENLEAEALKLSGIFASGSNTIALMNTRSEHAQYVRTSDAQITAVLAHSDLKWEVIAEQSAQKQADLDAARLHEDLAFLVERYENDPPRQLALGAYDIVFGPAATAELVSFMNWIGFDGGLMKRGFSFLSEADVGQKVFSEKFTLVDDPRRLETFPFKRDDCGIPREPYPLFQDGVFQGYVWDQDDADEFGTKPTGHTVAHYSLVLQSGDKAVGSLKELVDMPREKDLLYIPFLHYMNIVNPSQGTVTATSRFGTLYLKQDGSVEIPYNVRLTLSLLEIFGDKVAWLSKTSCAYNTSQSYDARNPTAVIVPRFLQVNDLEISHSNPSY
jgi:predicted Zn-dependent protease